MLANGGEFMENWEIQQGREDKEAESPQFRRSETLISGKKIRKPMHKQKSSLLTPTPAIQEENEDSEQSDGRSRTKLNKQMLSVGDEGDSSHSSFDDESEEEKPERKNFLKKQSIMQTEQSSQLDIPKPRIQVKGCSTTEFSASPKAQSNLKDEIIEEEFPAEFNSFPSQSPPKIPNNESKSESMSSHSIVNTSELSESINSSNQESDNNEVKKSVSEVTLIKRSSTVFQKDNAAKKKMFRTEKISTLEQFNITIMNEEKEKFSSTKSLGLFHSEIKGFGMQRNVSNKRQIVHNLMEVRDKSSDASEQNVKISVKDKFLSVWKSIKFSKTNKKKYEVENTDEDLKVHKFLEPFSGRVRRSKNLSTQQLKELVENSKQFKLKKGMVDYYQHYQVRNRPGPFVTVAKPSATVAFSEFPEEQSNGNLLSLPSRKSSGSLSLQVNQAPSNYMETSEENKSLFDQGERRPKQRENSCKRVKNFMSESSLFLFHKDWEIRQFCILLQEDKPVKGDATKKEANNEQQQVDAAMSQNLKKQRTITQDGNLFLLDHTGRITSARQRKLEKFKDKSRRWHKLCPTGIQPNKIFENVIMFLIMTSSIMLAIDTPLLNPDSKFSQIIRIVDKVHTVLFTIEASIKIIARGFFHNKLENQQIRPYFRDEWNILDFFVVCASLLDILSPSNSESLKSLKALRALRALRPLRMIARNQGMKRVVTALLSSLPSMTNVIIVSLLLMLIYAIMGVNFFKGTFYHCSELPPIISIKDIDTKDDCISNGGLWENHEVNFDNVTNAMLCLFQMMTTEGWMEVMYHGIDARGVDLQPQRDSNLWAIIYFIGYMILGSQFIINLFVGVVIDTFTRIKDSEEMGNVFVTDSQRAWIEIQKIVLTKSLLRQTDLGQQSKLMQIFSYITNSKKFEYFITGCIIANTICMAMVHHRMSDSFELNLTILNYFFAVIFNLEMFLKLLSMGKHYFTSYWNRFDFFIVVGTDAGIAIQLFYSDQNFSSATSVIRGFRIMRILRLVKASVHIRLIIDTLLNILPQITNIMALMILLLCIYAALGINLFSTVMPQDQINEKNNFQTFGNAMILLLRCSTGEDWNLIMYELANNDGCETSQTFEDREANGILGCGNQVSYIYFISFMIIISMLIMNLSVAAVIEGLDTARKENSGIVDGEQIDRFMEVWREYDPGASGWIEIEDLIFLLCELSPPLGKPVSEEDISNMPPEILGNTNIQARYLINLKRGIVIKKIKALSLLKNLHIKVYDFKDKNEKHINRVNFKDVLKSLLQRIYEEARIEYQLSEHLNNQMNSMWEKKHKELSNTDQFIKREITVQQEQAHMIIASWWRKYAERFKIENNGKLKGVKNEEIKEETVGPKPRIKKKSQRQIDREKNEIANIEVGLKILNKIENWERDKRRNKLVQMPSLTTRSNSQLKIKNQVDRVASQMNIQEKTHYKDKSSFTWFETGGANLLQEVIEAENKFELAQEHLKNKCPKVQPKKEIEKQNVSPSSETIEPDYTKYQEQLQVNNFLVSNSPDRKIPSLYKMKLKPKVATPRKAAFSDLQVGNHFTRRNTLNKKMSFEKSASWEGLSSSSYSSSGGKLRQVDKDRNTFPSHSSRRPTIQIAQFENIMKDEDQAQSEQDNSSKKCKKEEFFNLEQPVKNTYYKQNTGGRQKESPEGTLMPIRQQTKDSSYENSANSSRMTPAFLMKNHSNTSKVSRNNSQQKLQQTYNDNQNRLSSSLNNLKISMSNLEEKTDSEDDKDSPFNTDGPELVADNSSGVQPSSGSNK